MMEFVLEPLFEIEIEIPQYTWKADPNEIRNADGTITCADCGETMPNETLFATNHNRVFNGWCITHLLCNNGANQDQLDWLNRHGFEMVDRFDKRYWK